MKFLVSFIMALVLLFGINVQDVASAPHASSVSQSVEQHPGHDTKDPRARGKGKKKSLHRRSSSRKSGYGYKLKPNGDGNGKAKGRNHKKANRHSRSGKVRRHHSKNPKSSTNNKKVEPKPLPPVTVNCGGTERTYRQDRVVCVTIERPVETRVEYRTKTVTEKVLYSLGIITAAGFAIGIMALFLGFILGWRRAGKAEEKFLDSVLRESKE